MIPTTFSAHWRRAVETGDAAFTNDEDAIGFFHATQHRGSGVFFQLSMDERDHLADLRSSYPAESSEANTRAIYGITPANSAPASEVPAAALGSTATRFDFFRRAKSETPKPQTVSWDAAIARANGKFNGMASDIYARRNGKGD
ncbi:hypothetical protein [Mesorhizobium sp. M7A.F.Ca.US.008.03.1.1]|uniref:hypothetical protein n=1 Tax=Mesorhizobium sp. M7A.F.Ca.US.008.03.1.1 TaxID=2496742 RepID=UPI000FCC251F|nr:hypothetical protein [Mesorhizobium sp. M7A.F.Ca.US.008.03.1.1]RUW62126.1 hypothetical protein EOA16_10340 [Mesorhizobium sp. M7A.F.Ca.US.008.03.1.1]